MTKSPETEVIPSFPGDLMQPKQRSSDQGDLFRSQLDQILNRQHPLFKLADSIDCSVFEREFGSLYVENVGCLGLPIRPTVPRSPSHSCLAGKEKRHRDLRQS
jgi:hypothetical protein